jgi:hypothetical protein
LEISGASRAGAKPEIALRDVVTATRPDPPARHRQSDKSFDQRLSARDRVSMDEGKSVVHFLVASPVDSHSLLTASPLDPPPVQCSDGRRGL